MITEQGWREVCYKETTLLALMMRMGPRAKDHRWLLEAGRGKDTDSLLEPPEGTSLAGTLTMAR